MRYLNTFSLFGTILALSLLPASALAWFSGDAEATDSSWSAGTLSVTVDDTDLSATIYASGTSTPDSFNLSSTGSIDPKYKVTATQGSCADSFWNGLSVYVTRGSLIYHGSLAALTATSTAEGEWSFSFEATGVTATQNESCAFTLDLSAWQDNLPDNTLGFSASSTINVVVTAGEDIGQQPTGNIVLNEIYPNSDNTASAPLDREWVELYNGTANPIDIEGWDLSEMSGVNENKILISSSNTCAPGSQQGYARPYNGASTTIMPGGLLVIELCENNALNNNGDTVRLYDTGDVQVDSYTYGNTAKGKSHARIPDGGTWVDPIPTPGEPNVATPEELSEAGWSDSAIEAVTGETPDDNESTITGDGEAGDMTDDTATSSTDGTDTADGGGSGPTDNSDTPVIPPVKEEDTEDIQDPEDPTTDFSSESDQSVTPDSAENTDASTTNDSNSGDTGSGNQSSSDTSNGEGTPAVQS